MQVSDSDWMLKRNGEVAIVKVAELIRQKPYLPLYDLADDSVLDYCQNYT